MAEIERDIDRMKHAKETISVGKISGAVGTYADIDPFVEKYVCEHLASLLRRFRRRPCSATAMLNT